MERFSYNELLNIRYLAQKEIDRDPAYLLSLYPIIKKVDAMLKTTPVEQPGSELARTHSVSDYP